MDRTPILPSSAHRFFTFKDFPAIAEPSSGQFKKFFSPPHFFYFASFFPAFWNEAIPPLDSPFFCSEQSQPKHQVDNIMILIPPFLCPVRAVFSLPIFLFVCAPNETLIFPLDIEFLSQAGTPKTEIPSPLPFPFY